MSYTPKMTSGRVNHGQNFILVRTIPLTLSLVIIITHSSVETVNICGKFLHGQVQK